MTKWMWCVAVAVAPALALAAQAPTLAGTDFAGTWTYNRVLSDPRTSGNSPTVPFHAEVMIAETAGGFHFEGSTVRQDGIAVDYTLDGTEVTVPGQTGMTTTSKAVLEGETIVITSTRRFMSPAGEMMVDIREVLSVDGDGRLTIEKTQSTAGNSATLKGVYERASP